MRRYITILCIISVPVSLQAQDRYFTQFFANPLDLNPALTGALDGSFRVTATYRDQWRGFVESPFVTAAAYGDLRFELGLNHSGTQDYIGAGISFVADKASFFDLNTNQINLSGAFHKNLNPNRREYLSGGLVIGITQKNINYEELSFSDQFNGLDGYTLGTNETLPENTYAFFDMGVGINYTVAPSKNNRIFAGVALMHPFEPDISNYTRTEGFEEFPESSLSKRLAGYASAEIAVNKLVSLLPRILYQRQGPHTMLNASGQVKFDISKQTTNNLLLGAGVRFANEDESLGPNALVLLTGLEIGNFLMGLSYDHNLNDLFNDQQGQGSFEISISFIGEYENSGNLCPTF